MVSLDVSGVRDLRIPNSVPYRGSRVGWLARLTTTTTMCFYLSILYILHCTELALLATDRTATQNLKKSNLYISNRKYYSNTNNNESARLCTIFTWVVFWCHKTIISIIFMLALSQKEDAELKCYACI